MQLFDSVCVVAGLLSLAAGVIWMTISGYLYLLHRKYAHIPSPQAARYVLCELCLKVCWCDSGVTNITLRDQVHTHASYISASECVLACILPLSVQFVFADIIHFVYLLP